MYDNREKVKFLMAAREVALGAYLIHGLKQAGQLVGSDNDACVG